jgi:hypothetical protein
MRSGSSCVRSKQDLPFLSLPCLCPRTCWGASLDHHAACSTSIYRPRTHTNSDQATLKLQPSHHPSPQQSHFPSSVPPNPIPASLHQNNPPPVHPPAGPRRLRPSASWFVSLAIYLATSFERHPTTSSNYTYPARAPCAAIQPSQNGAGLRRGQREHAPQLLGLR